MKISLQTTKITTELLTAAIYKISDMSKNEQFGEQSLKKIFHKGKEIDVIPVTNDDIKGLKKELKRFGIDFAVEKNSSEKNMFNIYFKGQDAKHIQEGLKNYISKKNNEPFRQVLKKMKEKAREMQPNQPDKYREQGAR